MNENDYLKMQKKQYNSQGKSWQTGNKDAFPVGKFFEHNEWEDYDKYLFSNIEEKQKEKMLVLEYGCGPGRNIVKYGNDFKRVDGVDISETLIEKAQQYVKEENIDSILKACDGKSIPHEDSLYDIIFSVICLQHIASFKIRDMIIKDIHRVLKSEGKLYFQMGYGGSKNPWTEYYSNEFDAQKSNGAFDVSVTNENDVIKHLETIGFKNISFNIAETGPNCKHKKWIWFKAEK